MSTLQSTHTAEAGRDILEIAREGLKLEALAREEYQRGYLGTYSEQYTAFAVPNNEALCREIVRIHEAAETIDVAMRHQGPLRPGPHDYARAALRHLGLEREGKT